MKQSTLIALVLAVTLWCLGDRLAAESPQYNRDIRPILSDKCFSCHGADSASRKADLRLDQRENAVEMGAITAGDLDASEMIHRILSDDPETLMPPPETKKALTAEEIETLTRWVEKGAEYQPHWSLIAPTKNLPSAVKNEAWIKILSTGLYFPASKRKV